MRHSDVQSGAPIIGLVRSNRNVPFHRHRRIEIGSGRQQMLKWKSRICLQETGVDSFSGLRIVRQSSARAGQNARSWQGQRPP